MPVTILKGLLQSGVTLHKMEKELDSGDILLQKAFDITKTDNLETITETICKIASELCEKMVGNFDFFWNNAKPQGEYEYWPEPPKEDYTITPSTPPEMTERILRAFYGFECCLQISEFKEMCILRGEFLPYKHSFTFGSKIMLEGVGKGYAVNGGIIVLRN